MSTLTFTKQELNFGSSDDEDLAEELRNRYGWLSDVKIIKGQALVLYRLILKSDGALQSMLDAVTIAAKKCHLPLEEFHA